MSNESSFLFSLILSTLGFPVVSALLSAAIKERFSWISPILSSLLLLGSMTTSLILFFECWSQPPVEFHFNWFSIGDRVVEVSFLVNNLTLVMLLIVSGVSFLVHVYSVGYMVDDQAVRRYFAMLGLFTFSMLGLVITGNLLLLFCFWELVGVSSYFLIGHWRDRAKAGAAATKAFLMNRIGDTGFLIGLLIIWSQLHTFDISALSQNISLESNWQNWLGVCIFLGVVGKSAQFPLLTWLPDAMEGPTPVSALIHAATMVAAGVFLLVRINFIFTESTLLLIGMVGTITAIYGALFALRQFDIKKILAYSTISQLGVMVLGIGAGAWAGGLMHLFTHAFFKAGLFLCAGAIIHSLHQTLPHHLDPQDVRNMGGLRKQLPNIFIAGAIAAAGLAGIPFFSGFLSKEAILTSMIQSAVEKPTFISWFFVAAFLIVSFITVVYTFRLIALVFFGEPKERLQTTPTPAIMLWPAAILAVCTLWITISFNPFNANGWFIKGFVEPHAGSIGIVLLSVVWTATALVFSFWMYKKGTFQNESVASVLDAIYDKVAVQPFFRLAQLTESFDLKVIDKVIHVVAYVQVGFAFVTSWIDRNFVDGAVVLIARSARGTGNIIRTTINGKIQGYVLWALAALVIFMFWLLK